MFVFVGFFLSLFEWVFVVVGGVFYILSIEVIQPEVFSHFPQVIFPFKKCYVKME